MSEDQKVALITAGASGIGRAISLAMQRAGYRVHVADISGEAIAAVAASTPEITATQADLGEAADAERVFQDCMNHHGRVDVLVNNVGIAGATARVEDAGTDDWDRTI